MWLGLNEGVASFASLTARSVPGRLCSLPEVIPEDSQCEVMSPKRIQAKFEAGNSDAWLIVSILNSFCKGSLPCGFRRGAGPHPAGWLRPRPGRYKPLSAFFLGGMVVVVVTLLAFL